MTDLRPAPPEIVAVVGRLIDSHFPQLRRARIAVLARARAEQIEGEDGADQSTVAASGVNNDPALPFEFVTWYALEVWAMLDATERDAIVFHELMHMGRDADGKPQLRPHDAGVFNQEVKLYGVWWESAQRKFKARDDAREGGR